MLHPDVASIRETAEMQAELAAAEAGMRHPSVAEAARGVYLTGFYAGFRIAATVVNALNADTELPALPDPESVWIEAELAAAEAGLSDLEVGANLWIDGHNAALMTSKDLARARLDELG